MVKAVQTRTHSYVDKSEFYSLPLYPCRFLVNSGSSGSRYESWELRTLLDGKNSARSALRDRSPSRHHQHIHFISLHQRSKQSNRCNILCCIRHVTISLYIHSISTHMHLSGVCLRKVYQRNDEGAIHIHESNLHNLFHITRQSCIIYRWLRLFERDFVSISYVDESFSSLNVLSFLERFFARFYF